MPTRVFKTAEFARFAAKARIADDLLIVAIERVERGLVDADLGGRRTETQGRASQ